jgi:hypothetical protein
MGLKNVFGRNFWPIGQNLSRTATNEISKVGKMEGKNSKNLHFFY